MESRATVALPSLVFAVPAEFAAMLHDVLQVRNTNLHRISTTVLSKKMLFDLEATSKAGKLLTDMMARWGKHPNDGFFDGFLMSRDRK
jgi:hypothetical protein